MSGGRSWMGAVTVAVGGWTVCLPGGHNFADRSSP
eukprot:COSAG01_NODE_11744_length_1868_cov_2.430752_4_plen_34_part_01